MNEVAKSGAGERQAPGGGKHDGPAAGTDSGAGSPRPPESAESVGSADGLAAAVNSAGSVGDRSGAAGAASPSWLEMQARARAGWQRAVLSLGFALQPVLLLCVLAIPLQGWLGWIDRSYVVEARVTGARIVFDGNGNTWRLMDAVLCLPAERDLRSPPPELTPCGPAHEPEGNEAAEGDEGEGTANDGKAGDASTGHTRFGRTYAIDWPAGSEAVLRMDADRILRIEPGQRDPAGEERAQVDELPSGTFLLVSPEGWRRSGALLFVGQATLGTTMGGGETGFLLDGRYEVREQSALTKLVSDRSQLADSGSLTRGDRVEIVSTEPDEPAVTYGHLTISGEEDAGFHAVAVSGSGETLLQVWFYGLTEPVRIRPSWMDSIGTNPVLIALVVVLALVANLTQLLPKRTD